jgi:hypothetical protein
MISAPTVDADVVKSRDAKDIGMGECSRDHKHQLETQDHKNDTALPIRGWGKEKQ